ncbi:MULTISPECIES: SGNH/GDSL hydrolase family protein [Rhodomicrobium]|uniref:SGNH/GDSL hydrolase family protein n=1 Tax=Rhodomicrobium TaxID=1068 RepID=UPI000B4AF448|nr:MULTISPECIES: SGNH/GDSL hydrolase family protein [Rhodomicrobium]
MKKVLFPALLLTFCLVLTAAFTEIAVRLVADDGMQFDLEMWKYARDVKVVSPDPLLGHEHGPDRKAKLMGVEVATNSKGQRDREIPYERTPGVLRIAMVGDSLTEGWGVPFEDTFSKRIERLYEAAGSKAEIVNLGVGNWNTVQEVQYFLTKGFQYKPDIVVLNYFVNDAEPTPERRKEPSWLLKYCYSCVFVKGRIDTILRQMSTRQDWADYYLGLYDGGKSETWLAAKGAIKRLADYCKANNIKLLVAHLPELHDVQNYRFGLVTDLVQQAAVENQVPFVDLLPNLQSRPSADLWVTPPDPHPNALANELIAAGLFSALQRLEAQPAPDSQKGAALPITVQ